MVKTGGAGGPLGNATNWTDGSNNAGAGGGGGGGGGTSANVAVTSNGGNGANYGGGGGGGGGCRSSGSTANAGTGGGGLIVITYTPLSLNAVITTVSTLQEIPPQPQLLLLNRALIQPGLVPPGALRIFTTQQYPDHTGFHPKPFLNRSLVQPGSVPPGAIRLLTSQQQPDHPGPVRNNAIVQPGSTAPGNLRLLSIQRLPEQPGHPLPWLRPSRQGPDVQISVTNQIYTVQSAPDHPKPMVSAAVIAPVVPPLVGSAALTTELRPAERPLNDTLAFAGVPPQPITFSRQSFFYSSAGHSAALARDLPGRALAAAGQPSTPVPPITKFARTVQEQPGHPVGSTTPATGIAPSTFLTPEARRVLTSQQQPDHPAPLVLAARQGPDVLPASAPGKRAFTVQEQPYHPGSLAVPAPSYVASTFLSPETRRVLTAQQLPDHPAPLLRAAIQGPDVLPASAPGKRVVTAQEQPGHPAPFLPALVQPSTPVPPVTTFARTTQEQPGHPGPLAIPAPRYVTATLLEAEIRRTLTSQQQPDHPPAIVRSAIQGPDVLPASVASKQRTLTVQEQPGHPAPYAGPARQGPDVVVERRSAVTAQEQPYHPAPLLRAAIQGPDVAVGIRALLTKVEEITGHPQPFLRSSIIVPPPELPAIRRQASLTRQEAPDHPGPSCVPGKAFPGLVSSVVRQAFTVMEQPREAPCLTFPGIYLITHSIIGKPPLLGSQVPIALRGSKKPTNLLGEIDQ
jgi:hypothetical protein